MKLVRASPDMLPARLLHSLTLASIGELLPVSDFCRMQRVMAWRSPSPVRPSALASALQLLRRSALLFACVIEEETAVIPTIASIRSERQPLPNVVFIMMSIPWCQTS